MSGILDDIFAGDNGITNYLHGLLGGTAYFTYASDEKPVYNVEKAEYDNVHSQVTEPFPFIAYVIDEKDVIAHDQILKDRIDIKGSIPYSNITTKLRENIDKFTYCNNTYLIVRIQTYPVGNQQNRVMVYGKLIERT